VVQAYWGADVKSCPYQRGTPSADERITQGGVIVVCDVIIDGKLVGCVTWNGKELAVEKIDELREKIVQQLREQLGREPTESEIQTSLKSIDENMG